MSFAPYPTIAFLAAGLAVAYANPVLAQAPTEDTRPLSPAQIVLFETPHLRNVTQTGTLAYDFVRDGTTGFSDTVAVHVRRVNPNGTKDLAFEYLTGPRRVQFPELDGFRGNPVVMHTLERDTIAMKDALGVSSNYFRNKIREAFVSATVSDATYMLNGKSVPARVVVVRPFERDARLQRMASVQAKTYTFVLADAVPGTVAEIRIEMPADGPMAAPAFAERVTFKGVTP